MSYVVWLIFFFVVLMIGGIIGILKYQRSRRKNLSDKVLFLKATGKKLKVQFQECDIVHREYFDENEKGEKIKKDISIITFQTDQINGQKILFKTLPVFLAADELKGKLISQKNTTIYYDPSNIEVYYFDVEFLLAFMSASKER